MFKVGEKVVYPAHGVGEIEAIRSHVISGTERKFYMLRILETDMKIMIPIDNVESVGLRKVIDRAMVSKVYKVLRQKKVETDQQTWNRRYREYTEKIKTGSILEIAKVLRDLFVLKGDKELSFGERKMSGHGPQSVGQRALNCALTLRRENHGRVTPYLYPLSF